MLCDTQSKGHNFHLRLEFDCPKKGITSASARAFISISGTSRFHKFDCVWLEEQGILASEGDGAGDRPTILLHIVCRKGWHPMLVHGRWPGSGRDGAQNNH